MDAAPSWHRPERRFWRRGRWRLELRGDELADITFDGRIVLRSIRAVVRDADWNTAAWTVAIGEGETLSLLLSTDGDLGCAITGSLTARATDASLSVTFEATADAAFDTNRTGLVVLHPPALAGTDLTVTHPDGTREHTAFPAAISPHQPAFEIAALSWTHAGTQVAVEFSGDVFEMEDQRNWTDASYKTYSRPLSLPFPYRLEAGERVRQGVKLAVAVDRTDAAVGRSAPDPDVLELSPAGGFPAIGVGASTAPNPAPAIAPLGSFVLVELNLASPTWRAALARAAASGLPLDVRFVLDENAPHSIQDGVDALRDLPVSRVAAFRATGPAAHVSDATATAALREALAEASLSIPVVGGVRSHFTELNREFARIPDDVDGIVFSVTPLFHSTDTEQLVESLAMQRLVTEQAARMAAGLPVHVGPVTLRPRFNNVATAPEAPSAQIDLSAGYGPEASPSIDPRQWATELAAWTIASAAALAVTGVEALTFFEEWGPRGIRATGGHELPAATAVRELSRLAGSEMLTADSPDGLIWAIGAATTDRTIALVANLDESPRTITLRFPTGTTSTELDAGAWHLVSLAD